METHPLRVKTSRSERIFISCLKSMFILGPLLFIAAACGREGIGPLTGFDTLIQIGISMGPTACILGGAAWATS